jgi:hypothetical protein
MWIFLPLMSLSTVCTVTHSRHTSAPLPRMFFTKDRKNSAILLQVFTIFVRFILCQISCWNFWVDRKLQTSTLTLFYIRFSSYSLKFLLRFSFVILNHMDICRLCFVFCERSDLCDKLVTGSEKSYLECVCVYLCVI